MSQTTTLVPTVPEEGNTNSSSKQPSPAKNWCFTFNNYTEEDIKALIEKFSSNSSKIHQYLFEEEVGEECKTPHLQGFIVFTTKGRWSQLKLSKKISWRRMNGSVAQNIEYCSKDHREDKTKWRLWKSANVCVPKPLKIITELRPWQSQLETRLLEEPDDRNIIWCHEPQGKVGKSAFAKYMIHKHNALYITEGKKSDIINIVYNYCLANELEILILDVPRANGNKISYKVLEEIKNGLICNTKFETGNKIINPPNIVVFANSPPEVEQMSLDRWEIYGINTEQKLEEENSQEYLTQTNC